MKERKYKEDYSLESFIDDRGREKRRAVYKGEWFSLDASDVPGLKRHVLITMLLFTAFYLIYMKLSTPSAFCMYVLPVAACALIPLVYWCMGVFTLWRAPEKMTRLEKETGVGRVLRSSVGCGVLLGMAVLADIIYMIFGLKGAFAEEVPGFAALACAAACALACFHRTRVAYDRVEKVSPPGGGDEK